jgi:hypothetical protein
MSKAKFNGLNSRPNKNEMGWWWQKAYLDDIDRDIEEAIVGFRRRFNMDPLHAIVWGSDDASPITIQGITVWQDPDVPQNVVVLQ